jgi:FAD/FMN-containing dehydrogenase
MVDMSQFLSALRELLGDDQVVSGAALQELRRNFLDSAPLQAMGRVRPRSTAELSQIMRLCHAHRQPVVAHGGLTGHSEGDRTTAADLVVSLERMTRIEEIDVAGRTLTVQAGCILETAQTAVAEAGLYLPLDLGGRGSCTIGGNVSTNAGGTNVIRYGMARALVLGLEVVLADGTIVSSMNRMLKNNTGYDLKQLFIGSEGTLGIVTRIILALEEQSSSLETALVAFDNGAAMSGFLKHVDRRLGGTLNSYEVMWGNYYHMATGPGFYRAPLARDYPFYAIVEARGPDPDTDATRFAAAIEAGFEAGLIVDAVIAKSGAEREAIWGIRENFLAGRSFKPKFVYDIGLPVKDMLSYVEEVRVALHRVWPTNQLLVIGHLGDGNLHLIVVPGSAVDPSDSEAALEISDSCVYPPLERCGGAVSAEHGVGLQKKKWMPITRNAVEIELMRTVKRALDPRNILNRGKVVDV